MKDQAVVKPVGHFLNSDWWWRAQSTGSGAIPGLMALGSTREQAEQAMAVTPVSSTPPWLPHQSVSTLFLVPLLTPFADELCYGNELFPPQVAFTVFITAK